MLAYSAQPIANGHQDVPGSSSCHGHRSWARQRRGAEGHLPPPRRGQIKEKIVKDVVATVAAIAAVLVRVDKTGPGGGGGLPVAGNADKK
ncbi:hypothetical protein ACP70R_039798 [Stipagrostis hirtigluma subsp. patula]